MTVYLKFKELFYSPENDKYILYEECIQGYTIESMLSKGTCFGKKFVIKNGQPHYATS